MAKRGSSKPGGKKMPKKITGKQRVARIRNIAVARKAKKSGMKPRAKASKVMKKFVHQGLGAPKKKGGGVKKWNGFEWV